VYHLLNPSHDLGPSHWDAGEQEWQASAAVSANQVLNYKLYRLALLVLRGLLFARC